MDFSDIFELITLFIFGSVWFVIPCIAGLVSIIYLFFGQKRRLKKVIASDDIKAAEI